MKEMDELRDQLTENEKKMKKLSIKDRKVRDKHREVESKGQELRKERDRQNKEVSMWETQRLQIETKSAQLTNMIQEERRDAQGTSTAAEQERRRITEMQHENARRRAETIASIAQIVDKLASVIHEIATVSLSGHSDMARLRLLRVEAERYKEAIADAKRQFDEANASYEEAKQHAKRCLEETRSLTEKMTDDERQAVRDLQNQRRDASFEDLEIELSTCQQRLNLASNSGLTARVMEQYEERKQRLQAMHDTLRKAEAELSKVRKKKERLREQWEQPLERLVRQIGATFQQMFDRMDCMGEVRLKRVGDGITAEAAVTNGQEPDSASPHDDEDYDNWGVEIMVSFRRNEPLKPLNNHRQSGGERAVSTILYLQSLQALVAAPFRVVDEINQGMDQRNERLIHRQIVDTACKRG
ncbi:Structural maintenance of chromosomes protein 5, partial [Linderina pennispora]